MKRRFIGGLARKRKGLKGAHHAQRKTPFSTQKNRPLNSARGAKNEVQGVVLVRGKEV